MIHRQYRLSARVILVLATFLVGVATIAAAAETFRNTVDGSELDLSKAQAGEKPDAVETFEQTGKNPLNGDEGSIEKGKEEFLVACAGCHGHHAKGKLGPSLIDDYWTYPANAEDKGLFSTIFGGARAQMGPHYMSMTKTEMLETMAFLRDIYEGKASKAEWLDLEGKKALIKERKRDQSEGEGDA
ncbi:cytochrome c(L), periplasmic [Salinisphaera orenii]|uniref:cytochrome c(L), periplasmic n=1 Tax=Salinisphaera orenii TaxID=856731 RepID=UPI000F477DE7|nr:MULTISPECIES: cytochrome c(L), periplasmic [Salinisphaera]